MPSLDGVGAVLFTSANGVRAFQRKSDRRDRPAFCVGPSTSHAAELAGFGTCYNADGDADALFRTVVDRFDPKQGRLLHCVNEAGVGHLSKRLEAQGYGVEVWPAYRMDPEPCLNPDAIEALQSDCVALIHSAKGAEAFYELVKDRYPLDRVSVVAISQKAMAPLQRLPFKKAHLAAKPNEESLMEALDRLLSAL